MGQQLGTRRAVHGTHELGEVPLLNGRADEQIGGDDAEVAPPRIRRKRSQCAEFRPLSVLDTHGSER